MAINAQIFRAISNQSSNKKAGPNEMNYLNPKCAIILYKLGRAF